MRNNAWIALAIVGIIMAFALNSSNGNMGVLIDVLNNGSTVVNNTSVLDFNDPLVVTNSSGTAVIDWESTEVGDTIWADGTDASVAWEFDVLGAADPIFTFVSDLLTLSNFSTLELQADLDANLADDNTWIGNSSGRSTATAWSDCDLNFQATTYSTGSNAIGCQFIPSARAVTNATGTDDWSIPGWSCDSALLTIATAFQNDIMYLMVVPGQTTTYTAIGINVLTAFGAGTVARLGIYEANESSDGYSPGNLVVDAGTVSTATTGNKSIAISETLNGGQPYFLALVTDSTAAGSALSSCNELETQNSPLQSRGALGDPQNGLLVAQGIGIGALSDPAAAPDTISAVFIAHIFLSE